MTIQGVRDEFKVAMESFAQDSILPEKTNRKTASPEIVALFEKCIAAVVSTINNNVKNAENWQLVFNVLCFDWDGNFYRPSIHVDDMDRIAMKYSPYKEQQEAIITKEIESAKEWRESLEESDLLPVEGLSLAHKEAEMIVFREESNSAIAKHKSAIAIPQRIVQLYRAFYRAEKQYNPERTNALKPLLLAIKIIRGSRSNGEDLVQEVAGRIAARLMQNRSGTAKGRWVVSDLRLERQLILEFASFMVYNVLNEKFNGDKAPFFFQKRDWTNRRCLLFSVLLGAGQRSSR